MKKIHTKIKNKKTALILWFKDLGIEDVPYVGGKNAALGEMYANLKPLGINVPNGFAITASAYRYFIAQAGLDTKIPRVLKGLDTHNIKDLQKRGKTVRELIIKAELPEDLKREIVSAYEKLSRVYGGRTDVAVRSSATAEDLPDASFAGQQETYLNVRGNAAVLESVKKCIASLFTDRAISYRTDKGFSHFDIALSVGVQKMVRSDVASSGIMFTLDTETGFDKVVVINGSWGLGEMIVQGKVTPDEFIIFKPSLAKGFDPIIERKLSAKNTKMIYAGVQTRIVPVSPRDRLRFCITDEEAVRLALWGVKIEEYFSKKRKHYQPMDMEWAKDGRTKELFIVQARPETVHSTRDKNIYREYTLKKSAEIICTGAAVGTKIASGKVRIISDPKKLNEFKKGEILVTEITDPDWEPVMKIASAIVTDKGGRTSHAAIVSRELGIPCIVGTGVATKKLVNGKPVTVDCSSGVTGKVYKGLLPFGVVEHHLDRIPKTKTKIMVNIGSPDDAFKNNYLPVQGVGLGRLEFIIASYIRIHPNALLAYDRLRRASRKTPAMRATLREIEVLTAGYKDKTRFYIDQLAEGIAKIAAAFWPHDVIIRFSDFKTNEYKKLIGGEFYEPDEENPMLGWRGASRYYDDKFSVAFGFECAAIKKVRQEMGLSNVIPMVPFCRTPEEGKKVKAMMAANGLNKKTDPTLKTYVMCEIPSNVEQAGEFLDIFDGMSIGSNDLTQLALGLDRDSGIVSHISNENNPTVKNMIGRVIVECRRRRKYIGICGQAPSDYPEFARFLVQHGIESISLNPDTVIRTTLAIAKQEKKK